MSQVTETPAISKTILPYTYQAMLNPCIFTDSALFAASPVFLNTGKAQLECRWVDVDYLRRNMAAWDRLAVSAMMPNISFESNYLLPALSHLACPRVRVLAVELNSGEELVLIGLVPVVEKPIYRLPFKSAEIWKHDQCFDTTPLLHKDYATEAWGAICKTVLDSGYVLFSLDTVSAEAPFASVLEAVEQSAGQFRFQRDSFDRAAFTPSVSNEQYVKQFVSKNTRRKMNRLMRGFERLGEVTWEFCSAESDYESLAKQFLRIEGSGWKGKAGTALASNASTKNFFMSLIQQSSRVGKVRFVTLLLDQEPIAMICNIQSGEFVYSYKTAFDEAYAKYSPGIQVELKNLECLHRDGIQRSDSCSAPDNQAMNRIYGQRIYFQSLVLSLRPGLSRITAKSLPALQNAIRKIKRRN